METQEQIELATKLSGAEAGGGGQELGVDTSDADDFIPSLRPTSSKPGYEFKTGPC